MVSIIVPTLNEEKVIEKLLLQLNDLEGRKEIIIVDGGSKDRTVEVASKYGQVIKSKKGRANQMNKGAATANGNILWFVHSDSIVNSQSLIDINKAIDDGYIGGGFKLHFYDYNTKFIKFIEITSNYRAKYFGLYFGDQGMFTTKDTFEKVDGYPQIELMEDWELSRKISRVGKMKMINTGIGTSARRFKIGGQFKTYLLMQKIKFLYVLGVSPSKLNKIYRGDR